MKILTVVSPLTVKIGAELCTGTGQEESEEKHRLPVIKAN